MHYITCYPVGNGDSSKIRLESGRWLLFDYRQHPNADADDCAAVDLAKQLRKELKDDKRDYVDVLALTHGDRDHIEGSTSFSGSITPKCTRARVASRSTNCGCRPP